MNRFIPIWDLPCGSPAEAESANKHTSITPMTKTILTIAATAGTFALTSCIGLALWGADEGSQAMAEQDNATVRKTGETIQKGVKPIKQAKDDAIDAVKDAVDSKLFFVDTAFLIDLCVAVKTGCDLLADRRSGQQVARQLLDRKLIEGHIGIQRVDHPIAKLPNRPGAVDRVAVAVSIPCLVPPPAAPSLAVMRTAQQSVDQFLPCFLGIFSGGSQELIQFIGRRRQSDQIKADASNQSCMVGSGRRLDSLGVES